MSFSAFVRRATLDFVKFKKLFIHIQIFACYFSWIMMKLMAHLNKEQKKVSLELKTEFTLFKHSSQRVQNPLFYEDPLYCLPSPPFFQIFSSLPFAYFVALFLWPNVWSRHKWFVILLNNIMDLNLLSFSILVPAAHIYLFFEKYDMVFTSTLIRL